MGARGVLLLSIVGLACAEQAGPEPYRPRERDAAVAVPAMWRACGCDGGMPGGELMQLTHGPLLGAVSDRSIKVWARGDRAGSFVVRVWPSDEPDAVRCSAPVAVEPSLDMTGVAWLLELEPSTRYGYRLEVAGDDECSIAVTEDASFRTLPKEGEPARIRFAVGADVAGESVPGFADMEAVAPDFVLMIGDNVYADGHARHPLDFPADFDHAFLLGQKLYHEVWGSPQFESLFSKVPVFMTWDDHELMENYWRGRNDLIYDVGRTLYDSYQGSHNPSPLERGELYYSFRAADVGFFVFDTRTHRDGNMEPDDADKSMLGDAQRQAFEEWLVTDDSKVHVIVSSVIVGDFTTTGHDPWKSFKVERDAWLDLLAEHGTENTFVVSGDQHWSAILHMEPGDDVPYSLYEFQCTPLAKTERHGPPRTDGSVVGLDATSRMKLGVFDIDTRVSPPRLDYTLCAVGEPCAPTMEPGPVQLEPIIDDDRTYPVATLPYSASFEGSERGFVRLPDE